MMHDMARKLRLIVARAVINLVNDANGLQLLQVSALADETRDGVERVQNYGITSVPLAGATAVLVAVAGSRDHLMAVAVDDPATRPQGLQPGEVCIYTDEGDRIHMKRGRVVEITTSTLRINATTVMEINAPILQINVPVTISTGAVQAAADITDNAGAGGSSMAAMRSTYDNHDHNGVQHGTDTTGKPNQVL